MKIRDFETDPPTEDGEYLYIRNRWIGYDDELPFHQWCFLVAKYKNGDWKSASRENLADPDEWAELPFLTPPPRPDMDMDRVRKNALRKLTDLEREALGV